MIRIRGYRLILWIQLWLVIMVMNPRIHGFTTTIVRSRSSWPCPYRIAPSSTPLWPLWNGQDTDGWKAGDVYGDLNRLEAAITLANAEQNLLHRERLQRLDHHAQARRPLDDDVSKFIIAPLLFALVLRILPIPFTWQILVRTCSNGQFRTMIVMAPIFLWIGKRIVKPPPEPMPEELQGLAPEYLEFVTTVDYERPDRSCKDNVLVLLEYWSSAVAMMAISGILRICTRGWMTMAQLVIRLAVVASLYQNPQQVYQVRRHQQPRPMPFFPTILQSLISTMFAWLPCGIALDLYQLFLGFSNEALVAFYGTACVLGVGLWARFQQARADGLTRLKPWTKRDRLLYIVATMVIWRRPITTWMTSNGISLVAIQELLASRPHEGFPILQKVLTKVLLHISQGVFLLLVPLLHVRSLLKLVRIVYTHDVSLAGSPDDIHQAMQEPSRMKWRHRLEWQEESKRFGQAFKEWKDNLGYWFFFEGRVQDRMIQELKERLAESSMTNQVWRLSDRILDEVKQGKSLIPPDQWKKYAMNAIAQKHQMDYDRKEFDDPLGVAVQQTLGIGLGFNFDHDTPLQKGQTPSLRRLQARAAKSAIRRVQELYNANAAARELAAIADPQQRNAKAAEMRQRTQQEIETLAKRLTDLVPSTNDQSIEFKDRLLMQRFKQSNPANFVRVSSHEFRALDPLDAVSLVESDLKTFGKNKSVEGDTNNDNSGSSKSNNNEADGETTIPDPLGKVSVSSAHSDSSSPWSDNVDDDEFLEEYLRQQKAVFSSDDDNDDDNNPAFKVVLA